MSRAEVDVLRKDLAIQTAEIRSLRTLISDMLPKLSNEVAACQDSCKVIVDEALIIVAALPCRSGCAR
jgi:hypothetical protein